MRICQGKPWNLCRKIILKSYLITLCSTLHFLCLVSFLKQPRDVVVRENAPANFSCLISNGNPIITWIINMRTFSPGRLPNGHRLLRQDYGQVLVINNVQLEQNGSTYQCAVATTSVFERSNIGKLFVGKFL